jgi:hypothetical protein
MLGAAAGAGAATGVGTRSPGVATLGSTGAQAAQKIDHPTSTEDRRDMAGCFARSGRGAQGVDHGDRGSRAADDGSRVVDSELDVAAQVVDLRACARG